MPWCQRLDFVATFAKEHKRTYPTSGHAGFEQECAPVFHPDFAPWARDYAARLSADANDPSILGIFTDNEIQCPVNLLDRHLSLDPNDDYLRYGRAAAEAWLKARGTSGRYQAVIAERPAGIHRLILWRRIRASCTTPSAFMITIT